MDKQQEENISSSSPGRSGGGAKGEGEAAGGLGIRAAGPTFIGKHRMAAAISHLHNQVNIIQVQPLLPPLPNLYI